MLARAGWARRLRVLACVCHLGGASMALAQEPVTDQVFVDPELQDEPRPTPTATTAVAPASNPTDAHARSVLHTRVARDLKADDPREEVWESTTLATLEATLRRSESLRFALGLRARYRFASLEDDVSDAAAERHELDVVPTSAYADLNAAPGLHLQLGYQGVQLGRFDIFSATNVLAVNDLRDGPATLPEAGTPVGQLAALVDYDISSALSVRFIYVPFFTPHLVSLTESDYALFPASQAETEAALAGAAGDTPGASRRLTALVRKNLSRDDRAQIASSGFDAFAPEPTLTHPQAALRVTAHGPAGEVAFTAATALEHLPSLVLSQSLIDYLDNPSFANEGALGASPDPATIRHGRFFVLALDGAVDVGPVALGAEAAFMKDRALYALRNLDMQEGFPVPGAADLVQVGLRAEWVHGSEWLAVLESFAAFSLADPSDALCKRPRDATIRSECQWMILEHGNLLRGVAALLAFSPADTGLRLELGGGVLSGPSFGLMPRIAYEVLEGFEVETGALIVGGKPAPAAGAPSVALGGVYGDVDNVFVGLRYLP
jgi:hypothetical protein